MKFSSAKGVRKKERRGGRKKKGEGEKERESEEEEGKQREGEERKRRGRLRERGREEERNILFLNNRLKCAFQYCGSIFINSKIFKRCLGLGRAILKLCIDY